MRVRVFKKQGGKFVVLLTNRGRREYAVRLMEPATVEELKKELKTIVKEMKGGVVTQLKMGSPKAS